MAKKTQRQRIAEALRRYPGGITAGAFDGSGPILDNGTAIKRVASRVDELRAAGWRIDSGQRRHRMALYRLIAEPERQLPDEDVALAPEEPADTLFEPPAREPLGAYDDARAER